MGIGLIWQNSVLMALQHSGLKVTAVTNDKYDLLLCEDTVVLNLIPVHNNYTGEELLELQKFWQLKNITLVQLWEDVWNSRQEQVLGRILSLLGFNKRLHGRKGLINSITQNDADIFLNANHIHGSAKAKYRFSLDIDGTTVAVACFSNARIMKRISPDHRSVELIRFANLRGFTVTGGFTKLLKHFIKLVEPNDIMSYADRDWSLGNAYEQSGFKLTEITPPAQIWLRMEDMVRVFPHRLPADYSAEKYLPVFNTGNLKYIKFAITNE